MIKFEFYCTKNFADVRNELPLILGMLMTINVSGFFYD
jgi:hypothetical protein